MSLTSEDKTFINDTVTRSITEAIQGLITPRFNKPALPLENLRGAVEETEARYKKLHERLDIVEDQANGTLSEILALREDIKELYKITESPAPVMAELDAMFLKSSKEKQMRILHSLLRCFAQQHNITM